MFEYKRPIASIIDGPRFTIAQIGNAYCVVAPFNKFYKMYGAEKLNTVGKSKEGAPIQAVTTLNRYVVTAAGTEISMYNQDELIQKIDLGQPVENVLAYETFLVAQFGGSVARIDLAEMEKIESEEIGFTVTELANLPEGEKSMHRLALKNKLLVQAGGSLHIYSINRQTVVHTLKCVALDGPVVDTSNSLSPEIVAVATASTVFILQLKKDTVLQKFSLEGVQSVDFRKSMHSRELAVLTQTEVCVLCLEEGVVKKRHACSESASRAPRAHPHTLRYIGENGYIVVSQDNELRIVDAHKNKLFVVKRRAGIVLGKQHRCELLKDALVVSTNSRMYTLSLRKDEQLREFSKIGVEGSPVSISVARESILACYTKGVYSLEETVGGVAEKKRRLAHATPKEYLGAVLSLCGNSMALSVRSGEGAVKIIIASKESGFILGEVNEAPYLALSLNNIKKTLTVLHAGHAVVYSYGGQELSRACLSTGVSGGDAGHAKQPIGKIVETRTQKHYILAAGSHVHIFGEAGERIKSIEKTGGAPEGLRVSEDLAWILVMSSRGSGAVLEVLDIKSALVISKTDFPYMPRSFLLTKDKSRLVVGTDRQILLFENTYKILAAPKENTPAACMGISFSRLPKSRIQMLLGYEELGIKVESAEDVLVPYTMQKESTMEKPKAWADAQAGIDALLDENCPISYIIWCIKEAEDPSGLVVDLVQHLEKTYDIADALINRVIHYRRKDLKVHSIAHALKAREEVAERLVVAYMSTLSLLKDA
ncbi:uncharacterized protein NEMAJ01_1293 [Nematocida major]|uniref:uncharacterized protein n=1 Tax=Nematocida major TaxID=1912982 RepID=UPI0020088422|nr:uncharacterized protein NEMAJ01_1293 [Nematocida major]KAH9386397.1 hypothetical protein NEMAJ01_1293 [Nematocida major]